MNTEPELTLEAASQIVADIYIPPRPVVLEKIAAETQKRDYDIHKIADIISSDMAISAGVIKTVNSPFFGIPKEIVSIPQAVMLLGLKNVLNLVSALALREAITYKDKHFMELFWKESTEVALISTRIAREVCSIPADEFYMLGLLHNCGVPLLMQKFPDYPAIYQKAETMSKVTIPTIENKYFNINHALVGYIVGMRWKFPEYICLTISRHHDTRNYYQEDSERENMTTRMLAVLKTAEHISLTLRNLPDTLEWNLLKNDILTYLGIDDSKLESVINECRELT